MKEKKRYPGGYASKEAYQKSQEYSQRYGEEHFRRYQLRLRYREEAEEIKLLSKTYNVNRYVAELIKSDLIAKKAEAKKKGISLDELLSEQYKLDVKRYGKLR